MIQEHRTRRFDAVVWSLSLAFLAAFALYAKSGHATVPLAAVAAATLHRAAPPSLDTSLYSPKSEAQCACC